MEENLRLAGFLQKHVMIITCDTQSDVIEFNCIQIAYNTRSKLSACSMCRVMGNIERRG